MRTLPRYRDERPLVVRQAERLVSLKNEYEQGWRSHHELLAENMLPFGGRFTIDDRNIGDRRHGAIVDSTPLHAVRTLAAGLMSGATSPARPWFRLQVKDAALNEQPEVQDWLSDAADVLRQWINGSNLYHEFHRAYEEEVVFGTSVILLLPDDERLFHGYGVTAGRYYLATDAKGRVNTCYREMQMTTAQVVREFGIENVSDEVRLDFEQERFEKEVHVVHAIEPNDERYVEGSPWVREMRYRSTYFEYSVGAGAKRDKGDAKTLRDGGFDVFPVLVFRWNVSGDDVYGNSPGMEALGDAIQLQDVVTELGRVVALKAQPPVQVPPGMKHSEVDGRPGGVTVVPATGREGGVRPLYEVALDESKLEMFAESIRVRLRRTMHTDTFLMLQQIDKTMTAREAVFRNEEKLLMLGPMLTRLFDDGLKPCIDLVFHYAWQEGLIPEPPAALADAEIDVEFVSPLAQAQQGIGINAADRFLQTIGAVAGMKPDVLDILDEDEVARDYAKRLGVDPDLLRDPKAVATIREARAKQQAAMQQAEAMQQVAGAQKSVAEAAAVAPVDALDQATGYSNPAAVA